MRIGTFRLALALFAIAALARGQAEQKAPDGWTRTLAPDAKSWVWTINDSGGRGMTITYRCEKEMFEITTKQPLLSMADVEDGQIKVALLSPEKDRIVVNGYLSRGQTGVLVTDDDEDASDELESWIASEENAGQTITLLLSNNGLREVYTFVNRGGAIYDDNSLSCDMPKPKKH